MAFIVAISSILGLGVAPMAALAQTATIVDSDTTIQQNTATTVQNADELVDSNSTVTGGELQTSEVTQSNNLVDNDVNSIDQRAEISDSNVQTDVTAESNNPVDNNVNTIVNASGG